MISSPAGNTEAPVRARTVALDADLYETFKLQVFGIRSVQAERRIRSSFRLAPTYEAKAFIHANRDTIEAVVKPGSWEKP